MAGEDAFGLGPRPRLTLNTRWAFNTDPQKLEEFRQWLAAEYDKTVLQGGADDAWLEKYIEESYRRGGGRAFDDVRKSQLQSDSSFFAGQRSEFLNQAFGGPASVERVKLLASRTFTDLSGVTEAMSQRMTQVLTDGLIQGVGPRQLGRQMASVIDGLGRNRATTIARTEIVRAHAEGQLDAFEKLGLDQIGIAVEWSTTGDDRVCPLCAPLEGVVMSVKEARGTLPRHPNCRCAYIPANVGEEKTGQKRTAKAVQAAVKKSKAAAGKTDDWKEGQKGRAAPKSVLDRKETKKKPRVRKAKQPKATPPSIERGAARVAAKKVSKKATPVKDLKPAPKPKPQAIPRKKTDFFDGDPAKPWEHKEGDPVKMYHVTDRASAAKIEQEGFKAVAENQWQGFTSETQGVYGWADIDRAKYEVARMADSASFGDDLVKREIANDLVILEVEVPTNRVGDLVPDEDYGGKDWKESMKELKSAAVKGDLPASTIKTVYEYGG